MAEQIYDAIVLGLGANGSSALYHLSKEDLRVCGIDQFRPPHKLGSSHGQSRIIRQAYYENPAYVPLVKKAYMLWDEIGKVSGHKLLLKTGGIMIGAERSAVVSGSRRSAEEHQIPFEELSSDEIATRFPAFIPQADTIGILEKEAGILFPENCISAHLDEALKNGADIKFNEKVRHIGFDSDVVLIVTSEGNIIGKKLIVAAGAWLGELLPGLRLPLTVERQTLFWIRNANKSLQHQVSPETMPVFIWEYTAGKMFYGFPDLGDGIKIALHHAGRPITPDTLSEDVSRNEIDIMMEFARRYFNIEPVFNYSTTCMYTNTPDENFIVDVHPQSENVIIASPCSGHGFKFASFTGYALAAIATGKKLEEDLSLFTIRRFLH